MEDNGAESTSDMSLGTYTSNKKQLENQSLVSQDSILGSYDSKNKDYTSGDSVSTYTNNQGCTEDSESELSIGKITPSQEKDCKGIVEPKVAQLFDKDNNTKEAVNKSNISPNIRQHLPQVIIK